MSLLLRLLPPDLPAFIREEILAELFKATESAFGCPAQAHKPFSNAERLRTYALFTREQAENALHSGGDILATKTRLYQNAFPLGRKLRKWFAVDSMEEVMELGQILYRAIGIELQGDPQGSMTVKHCYFSQFYSKPVCELISALDDGLFSGLSGGGRLVFSERLTQGRECCRAKIQFGEPGIVRPGRSR